MATQNRRTTLDGRPVYTLRRNGRTGGFAIAVLLEIGNMIPAGAQFAFELSEGGLAFSIVTTPVPEDGLPEWLTKLNDDGPPEGGPVSSRDEDASLAGQ